MAVRGVRMLGFGDDGENGEEFGLGGGLGGFPDRQEAEWGMAGRTRWIWWSQELVEGLCGGKPTLKGARKLKRKDF